MAMLLTEIQRYLRQAHVWRFVGLASTTVGLSCYALSSSFNHMFGRWNFLKIVIYIVSSIIICFMILFAKAWQFSTALRFKAHLSFLALTITTVYSFFFDKNVNGKPDVYSLISCAAFSVMSLSLSKQSHFGFEVDLLYFFLGALTVQLMKIHLFLGIFGVGFSYFLIILRSSLDLENGHHRLDDQYHSVVQVDSDTQEQAAQVDSHSEQQEAAQVDSDLQQVSTDIVLIKSQFTACIEALKSCDRELINVLSIYAKDYIKTLLLESNYAPVDSNLVIDALPSTIINDLKEAAKFMLANGFEKECCDLYSTCRREYIEKVLSNLRLNLPNFVNFVEVQSIALEFVVWNWINYSNLAMKLLFPNERRLCERIFLGFITVEETIFTEICSTVLKVLHDLIRENESSLFSQLSVDSIGYGAINPSKRLGKETKGIFIELEDLICNDKSTSDVPGGLYPICIKTIECFDAWMKLLFQNLFSVHPTVVLRRGTPPSFYMDLSRIIELIERYLDVKLKSCPDRALRCIVAMNNVSHIEFHAKIWEWETSPLCDNGIIGKLNAKVRQNLEDYLRISWDKVIGLLKLGGTEPYLVESMKENLKLFNDKFKEICRVQSTWFVLDEWLRKEIIKSIDNILLSTYGFFIGELFNILGPHANEYIEYSMLDIDALLNDLFRG
ncbi:hypothetical protein PIB30_010615 [Stylosanthes scabra]|uniref:Exocyst subunit Exo70 family protein n=1 Tax=Stylosanthes scabra TaxID=79078 RepID=A0ABU6U4C5_9FABA|nr:hypothetical protein [Stylosanthes scabra]